MKAFFKKLDHPQIEQAIASAEHLTSGEIRVVLLPGAVADPTRAAQAEFARLEMHRTRERNAVLILVAPDARKFAIIGDEAVHAKCGDRFWQEVARAMEGHFRSGAFTAGIVEGIARAGRLLAAEFPRRPEDQNELPDRVVSREPLS